jgi:hypothetical protein
MRRVMVSKEKLYSLETKENIFNNGRGDSILKSVEKQKGDIIGKSQLL